MKTLPGLLMTATLLLPAAGGNPAAGEAMPWHPELDLANRGYWPMRVPVRVVNDRAGPVAGETLAVAVPDLEGARVESIRACRADGVELLFDLRDARGGGKRSGTVAAGDRLVLPVECDAKSTATIFVYGGNERAGAVPEFLPQGFGNGGFESGETTPDAWLPAGTDDEHRLTWEDSGGRDGSRCAKADVKAGAAPTWVQWQQTKLPVSPGRSYELRGWVRGEGVDGNAGWYIHVYGEHGELVNRTLNAGKGSFDWRQVSTRFTAPAGGRTATIGTVLHGTGRAWFDDAEFVETGAEPGLHASVGPVERMVLRRDPASGIDFGPGFPNRAEVVARNFDGQAASAALVRVNLLESLARLSGVPRGAATRVLAGDGRELPSYRLGRGGDLLIASKLDPASEHMFHIGFRAGVPTGADTAVPDYERLLNSPSNLIPNGDFEHGADLPEGFGKPRLGNNAKVTYGFSGDAKFGRRSIELSVPAGNGADWLGWTSQPIPVKPGATYLLSGWLKGVRLKGSATIHAHFHDAGGALCQSGAMTSTGPAASGDADWVNTTGFLTAPADAARITIHLTMNTQGTQRHDGVLLCEVVEGHLENLASATADTLPPEHPLHVWEVNPLVKVFPDTPPREQSRGVAVELAGNEYEPFQLALRGRAGAAIGNVDASVSPLKNAAGAELPPATAERVGFVPVDHPSGYYQSELPDWCRKVPHGSGSTDGWAGEWPDPLVPPGNFELAMNRTQPLWFTVHAPAGAAPGDYRGEIRLRANGRPLLTLPLTVKVLPFELPERTRLKAVFDFRRGPGGWYGPDGNSPEQREKWLRFIARHRLGINTIEPPPKFEYRDGKVSMDTSGFDATARLCFDELGMNVCYTPHFFYMFGWAYPPNKMFGMEPFTPEWTDAFRQAYQLFSDHLRERGWHDKFVYYISDEPHFTHQFVVEQMKKLCAMIHEVDPGIPVYSSTWRHCPDWDDSLDLWGVGQYGCFPVAEIERLQKAGKQVWFTCDGQQATDTPYLATERMLPYYCHKFGATGFEFWGISWWTHDPWKLGWHWFIRQSDDGERHYWIRYPNGDGYLCYPGEAVGVDGPVSSIRLEQVREGIEDHEAMALLDQLIARAGETGRSTVAAQRALTMAADLVTIPNAGGPRSSEILPDPDQIPVIRKAVNAAICELLK